MKEYISNQDKNLINDNFYLKTFHYYCNDIHLNYLENRSCKKRVPFFNRLSHHLMVIGGHTLNDSLDDELFSVINPSKPIINEYCEYFNPITLDWNRFNATLNEKRYLVGSTFTKNRIFVIGGLNQFNEPLSSVEYFDLTNRKWIYSTPMQSARQQPGISILNDSIYAFGGNNDGLYFVNFNLN